jgi:prepilin-type processing-associated H-X9-DG protein
MEAFVQIIECFWFRKRYALLGRSVCRPTTWVDARLRDTGAAPPRERRATSPPGQKMPGAINTFFADGHTQLVKLEDLWTF